MRDRRVDEAQQLCLGLRCIIQDLLRDVYESKHHFFGLVVEGDDFAPTNFEELESDHVFFVDALVRLEIADHRLEVHILADHIVHLHTAERLVEGEDFAFQVLVREGQDVI